MSLFDSSVTMIVKILELKMDLRIFDASRKQSKMHLNNLFLVLNVLHELIELILRLCYCT